MTTRSKQLLLIGGAAALTIALYFAPKKNVSSSEAPVVVGAVSFETIETKARAELKRQEVETLTPFEQKLKSDPADIASLDSLAKRWDALQKPSMSAHYFELEAEKKQDEKTWLNAAYRYFDAFHTTDDSLERQLFVEKAINGYKQVLKINPDNLDAKTDLGVCYTDGTNEPMTGIIMLREVVQKNPDHENAQFNLGVLSMRSGQYDKAVDRFKKVLSINPQRQEMYLAIGRAYMLKGETAEAKKNFEQLKKQTSNPALQQQATEYLNQIK